MMCLCLCMCDACVQKGFIEINSCESALQRCARTRQALRRPASALSWVGVRRATARATGRHRARERHGSAIARSRATIWRSIEW